MSRRRRGSSSLKRPFIVVVVILLVPTSARAEERAPAAWQLDVKASYVVLGARAARATGGIMPSLTGFHLWSLREAVDIGIGADVGLLGLGGIAHWIGVLGGPTATARVMPFSEPFTFDLTLRLDFGRIPVCNEWGLCLRYVGFFPAAEAGVAYRPTQHLETAATCGVRVIQTLAWSGVSVEPAAAGRIFW
jgi:hypothetical protein